MIGEHISDERHIREALPGADVGKISHPQLVWPFCQELAVHSVTRSGLFLADGGPNLFAATTPCKPHRFHQPCHRTSGNEDVLPEQLDPDPEYAPVIIRNNRLHIGCVFWQPADFSANSDGVIQPCAEWGRFWL